MKPSSVSFSPARSERIVAITGAANGIGRATARHFIQKGCFVAALDVDGQGLKALQQEFPQQVETFQADVTDSYAMQRAFEELASFCGGRIDVLINNAGVLEVGDFADIPLERQRRVLDINLWGVINSSWQALPYLKKAPAGCIVNISSASALHGHPLLTTYAASKAAVSSLTQGLHMGLSQHGIKVTEVQPLYVQTDMTLGNVDKWDGLENRDIRTSPEKVARAIWQASQQGRRHRRIGAPIKLMAFAMRLLPQRLVEAFLRRYLRSK